MTLSTGCLLMSGFGRKRGTIPTCKPGSGRLEARVGQEIDKGEGLEAPPQGSGSICERGSLLPMCVADVGVGGGSILLGDGLVCVPGVAAP